MTVELTPREAAILSFIKENIKQKGYPPSVREIGESVGLRSSSTVHSYLKRLEEKGLLRRDPVKPRAIEVLDPYRVKENGLAYVPVLGRVAAGTPVLAVENQSDVFPLPASFTGEGEFFMLTVKGESMIEAGILEGDLLIVRKQETATNGDIVVALIDEEATVKRFYKENDHIRLQPENRFLKPILVREVTILGKVIGLIRKFH